MNTVVLDKNPTAGALGITDKIENYPGILHPIAGKELVSIFRQQAEHFGATMVQIQVYQTLTLREANGFPAWSGWHRRQMGLFR